MRRLRFSKEQIVYAIRQVEGNRQSLPSAGRQRGHFLQLEKVVRASGHE